MNQLNILNNNNNTEEPPEDNFFAAMAKKRQEEERKAREARDRKEDSSETTKETSVPTDEDNFFVAMAKKETNEQEQLPATADDDIVFGREFAYGTAQEPTAIGSLWRITRAGIEAALDPNEDYEEARERIEFARQEKIFEKFPEFRGRKETAGVIAGRMGLAVADPITFLVPWVKIAKAGKIASIGSAGAFGAVDLTLREEALFGEIRPETVGLGFAFGTLGGAAGEGLQYVYSRAVSSKVRVYNQDGKPLDKKVEIKGETPHTVENIDTKKFNETGRKTLNDSEKNLENLGVVNAELHLIGEEVQILKNKRTSLKKEVNKSIKNNILRNHPYFNEGIDFKKFSKFVENKSKISKIASELKELQKTKRALFKRYEEIVAKEIPENALDVFGKNMINGFKNGILTTDVARNIGQGLVRSMFGGIIGGGIGATFTQEDDDNTKMLVGFALGAGLMGFQKTIQSKSFELIPQKVKDASGEEFIGGFRRIWWNYLKSLSAGSHIQDLLAWGEDVGIKYGARMFQPLGAGISLEKGVKVNPVELEAQLQTARWTDRYATMFGKHDDEIIILAGKISNQRGLKSKKHKFVSTEDKLHPRYNEADKLSKEIDKFHSDFSDYMRKRGIIFEEQDFYGITQILSPKAFTWKGDIVTNFSSIVNDLTKAFKIQNANLEKLLTKEQKANKKFMEEFRKKYPTYGANPRKTAEAYLNTASRFRNNSIFGDAPDDAVNLLFRRNDSYHLDSPHIKYRSQDEKFIFQAARHFDNDRTLFDQEARAFVNKYFENNPMKTMQMLVNNSVKIAEFAKQFGARGEFIKRIFISINNRYKKLADPTNQYKTVQDLFNNVKGVRDAANREKQKIKDSLEAYFGVYGAGKTRGLDGDKGKAMVAFLQTGLATTRLNWVAIPSMGDILQTFSNSGYRATIKALKLQLDAVEKRSVLGFEPSRAKALSTEGLALRQRSKQVDGKDVGWWDRFRGKNIHTNILTRELADVMLMSNKTGMNRFQSRMTDFTNQFFEVFQLGRVTRIARNWAFDAGVYRALDIAQLVKKGKSGFLKTKSALQKEMDNIGLNAEQAMYLSKFTKLEDALVDDVARSYLKKAGIMSGNRDAMIPMVGNRRLFTQTRDPLVKFLGSFLSWAQARTSQLNGLISRVEQGDAALFLKMAAALPIFMSVRELQVNLSPTKEYRDAVDEETMYEKIGEGMAYAGYRTWTIDKLVNFFKYSDYGGTWQETLAPVVGYGDDLLKAAYSPIDVITSDEADDLLNVLIDIEPLFKPIPIAEDIYPRIVDELELKREERVPYIEGGEVQDEYPVQFVKKDPKDRESDDLGGMSYAEQMDRLGFAEGTKSMLTVNDINTYLGAMEKRLGIDNPYLIEDADIFKRYIHYLESREGADKNTQQLGPFQLSSRAKKDAIDRMELNNRLTKEQVAYLRGKESSQLTKEENSLLLHGYINASPDSDKLLKKLYSGDFSVAEEVYLKHWVREDPEVYTEQRGGNIKQNLEEGQKFLQERIAEEIERRKIEETRINPKTGEQEKIYLIEKKDRVKLNQGTSQPMFEKRINNPTDYPFLLSEDGKKMTHRMADAGKMVYPMIQLQDDGTLKNYKNDFDGAREQAIKTGNYKVFETESEAQEYARGGYKTKEFEEYYK